MDLLDEFQLRELIQSYAPLPGAPDDLTRLFVSKATRFFRSCGGAVILPGIFMMLLIFVWRISVRAAAEIPHRVASSVATQMELKLTPASGPIALDGLFRPAISYDQRPLRPDCCAVHFGFFVSSTMPQGSIGKFGSETAIMVAKQFGGWFLAKRLAMLDQRKAASWLLFTFLGTAHLMTAVQCLRISFRPYHSF